jgi:hypothetical protein
VRVRTPPGSPQARTFSCVLMLLVGVYGIVSLTRRLPHLCRLVVVDNDGLTATTVTGRIIRLAWPDVRTLDLKRYLCLCNQRAVIWIGDGMPASPDLWQVVHANLPAERICVATIWQRLAMGV